MDSTIMGNDVALAIDNPLILKEERYKVPFEVTYAYFPDVRDEWLNEPYAITRKYNIINSEKVHTEVVRKIYGANQLHTDWSLVLPCGNTEMSFINAPSTHEDTYHRNICLGNGEHRIECTDPKESSLHVWRELCDPSCLTYKEVSTVYVAFINYNIMIYLMMIFVILFLCRNQRLLPWMSKHLK